MNDNLRPSQRLRWLRKPLTKKQKRDRERYEREHLSRYGSDLTQARQRKRTSGKATNQNERKPTTEREVKPH